MCDISAGNYKDQGLTRVVWIARTFWRAFWSFCCEEISILNRSCPDLQTFFIRNRLRSLWRLSVSGHLLPTRRSTTFAFSCKAPTRAVMSEQLANQYCLIMFDDRALNFRGKFGGKFNIPRGLRPLILGTFAHNNVWEYCCNKEIYLPYLAKTELSFCNLCWDISWRCLVFIFFAKRSVINLIPHDPVCCDSC